MNVRKGRKLGTNGVDLQLSGTTPIYVQLIVHFRHQIETGKWRLHQTIPASEDLAAEFGVTRATVRQAVGFLQREGLLSSRRGRGTEVIGKPRETLWQPLPNSWSDLVEDSDSIEGDVLELARPGRLPEMPQIERGQLTLSAVCCDAASSRIWSAFLTSIGASSMKLAPTFSRPAHSIAPSRRPGISARYGAISSSSSEPPMPSWPFCSASRWVRQPSMFRAGFSTNTTR